jgi:hypothetical protein
MSCNYTNLTVSLNLLPYISMVTLPATACRWNTACSATKTLAGPRPEFASGIISQRNDMDICIIFITLLLFMLTRTFRRPSPSYNQCRHKQCSADTAMLLLAGVAAFSSLPAVPRGGHHSAGSHPVHHVQLHLHHCSRHQPGHP